MKNYDLPLFADFHLELDESALLCADDAAKYRMMIGSLNWMVTLGRFDVHYATQTMSHYGMAPWQGHLDALKRIFGYLKHHSKFQIQYDTELPLHAHFERTKYDWFEHYGPCCEEMPHDMPEPKGNLVRITAYFDADHAGCLVTRRSTTGAILFLNSTPVQWYSKQQATVKSAMYGSEMVAGHITVELLIAMRYKLWMLGIPILGLCIVFGDNMSMIKNTTIPLSSLKKKHNAIGYHHIHEAVAVGIVDLIHIPSSQNLSDLLTKPLGPQQVRPLLSNFQFPVVLRKTTSAR